MKKSRCIVSGLAVAVGLLFLSGIFAVAQTNSHQQMQMGQQLKVGKAGEVIFEEPHKIGDVVLPTGTYRVVHRTAGGDHSVVFKQTDGGRGYGEVKCRIEPLAEKVENTAVYVTHDEGILRIVPIEIAGENVAHLI